MRCFPVANGGLVDADFLRNLPLKKISVEAAAPEVVAQCIDFLGIALKLRFRGSKLGMAECQHMGECRPSRRACTAMASSYLNDHSSVRIHTRNLTNSLHMPLLSHRHCRPFDCPDSRRRCGAESVPQRCVSQQWSLPISRRDASSAS